MSLLCNDHIKDGNSWRPLYHGKVVFIRSKLFIGWHKSIVSSDWSDTMVWFGQILLYLTFHILYTWSLILMKFFLYRQHDWPWHYCYHHYCYSSDHKRGQSQRWGWIQAGSQCEAVRGGGLHRGPGVGGHHPGDLHNLQDEQKRILSSEGKIISSTLMQNILFQLSVICTI